MGEKIDEMKEKIEFKLPEHYLDEKRYKCLESIITEYHTNPAFSEYTGATPYTVFKLDGFPRTVFKIDGYLQINLGERVQAYVSTDFFPFSDSKIMTDRVVCNFIVFLDYKGNPTGRTYGHGFVSEFG